MSSSLTILIVDDDEGHAILVRENLEAVGLPNRIEHFRDGQAILDFLFGHREFPKKVNAREYLVLLDIRMPKVDGIEVLRRIKADPEMKILPVIILTTTDDSREIELCHQLGCSVYIRKPVDYDKFAEAIRRLGMLIGFLHIPPVTVGN